jgi:uncharacterized protein DUF4340
MNPKKLLLLIIILLGAAFALQQWSKRAEMQRQLELVQQKEQEAKLPDQAALSGWLHGSLEDIGEITVHQTENLVILRFHPDDQKIWRIDDPFVDRAEPLMIEALLHWLFKVPTQTIDPAWQNSTDADLGLAEPRVDLEISFRDGRQDLLMVGAPEPDGDQHFATLNGHRLMIPRAAVDLLIRPSEHWRNRGIFQWPRNVRTVRWAPQDGPGFLIQKVGSTWKILEPIQGTLDPLRVKTLSRCLGSRVSTLPTDQTSAKVRQAFAERGNLLEVTATFEDHAPRVQTLRLHQGLAMDLNRPYLLAYNPDDFRLLQYTAEEIRSQRLVEFNPSHMSSIRILKDSQEFILRRSQSGWMDRQGERLAPGLQKRLQTMLVYLSTFEASALAEPEAGSSPRSILLSRAANPVPRGATMFRYWPVDQDHSTISVEGSRQKYQTDRNLDQEWDIILGLQDQ